MAWEGALQIISIQRLPWAGDPAMLTHGNADMSQLGEKTTPFPFSLYSILSSLDFSLSSLLHSLATARGTAPRTGMDLDCLFLGEMGIPCKREHLFSPELYHYQHSLHYSCFFQTHLSIFHGSFSPPWAFSAPSTSSPHPSGLQGC